MRPLGGYLEPCSARGCRNYLEPSSAILGHIEAVLRPLGGLSEAIVSHAWLSWAILKAILVYLGLSWSHLGPKRAGWKGRWRRRWRVFAGVWEALGAILGPMVQNRRRRTFRFPLGSRKIAYWGRLEALLGASWAILGPSWGPFGPFLGLSWAILGPS